MQEITRDMLVTVTSRQRDCSVELPGGIGARVTVFQPEGGTGYLFTMAVYDTVRDDPDPQLATLGEFSTIEDGLALANRVLREAAAAGPDAVFGLDRGEGR